MYARILFLLAGTASGFLCLVFVSSAGWTLPGSAWHRLESALPPLALSAAFGVAALILLLPAMGVRSRALALAGALPAALQAASILAG